MRSLLINCLLFLLTTSSLFGAQYLTDSDIRKLEEAALRRALLVEGQFEEKVRRKAIFSNVEDLVRELDDVATETVLIAGLALLRKPRLSSATISLLTKSKCRAVRVNTASNLHRFPLSVSIQRRFLSDLLSDQDCTVRSGAVYSIGLLKNPDYVGHILFSLRDDSEEVVSHSVNAIMEFEPYNILAIPFLIDLIGSTNTNNLTLQVKYVYIFILFTSLRSFAFAGTTTF